MSAKAATAAFIRALFWLRLTTDSGPRAQRISLAAVHCCIGTAIR
jgi:hypothetical protein